MLCHTHELAVVILRFVGLPFLCLYGGCRALPTRGIRVVGPPNNSSLNVPVVASLSRFDVRGLAASQLSPFKIQVSAMAKQPGTFVSERQVEALMGAAVGRISSVLQPLRRSSTSSMRGSRQQGNARAQPREVVSLQDVYGSEYVGDLEVGTTSGLPLTELRVIFDTGSTDLWVLSDLCNKSPCTNKGRHAFDHTKSDTFKPPIMPLALETIYGSGELRGQVGFDDVSIGPLVARGQMLGLITDEVGDVFARLPFDGLVGLGFPSLGSLDGPDAVPFVDNLIDQGNLPLPLFAFYLHSDPMKGGALIWGGVDERLYHGPLQWFPVVEEEYWTLDLVSLRIGDLLVDFNEHKKNVHDKPGHVAVHRHSPQVPKPRLVVDSGTTFFTVPSYLHQRIKNNFRVTSCSEIKHLPSMVFGVMSVSGEVQNISVAPNDYMVKGMSLKGVCVPGLIDMDLDPDSPIMIIGEVFMRHFFTVFSRGTQEEGSRVGFARAKEDAAADAFFAEVGV